MLKKPVVGNAFTTTQAPKSVFIVFDEDNHEHYGPFENEKDAKAAAYDLGEGNNSCCKVVKLIPR